MLNDIDKINLIKKYGSPLYVYDEAMLRKRCKEIRGLIKNYNFRVSYSAKANSNIELLKIIKDEDIDVDAMSPGEIFLQEKAGYDSNNIFYVCNNVSAEEMKFAIDRGILVSVDSISQLQLFGEINPGGDVAIRINPGIGAGHHEKVVTGGDKSKFGIEIKFINRVKEILQKYNLNLVGINQHIGSLFLETHQYISAAKSLLEIANNFKSLKFIDFGGGFGIPYHNEERLNLNKLSEQLEEIISDFIKNYDNKDICFKAEPGRYLVAESGILLGTVHSVKENYTNKYIGTDIGFNVLMRPVLYDSYHSINVISKNENNKMKKEQVIVVGNICESGDIISYNQLLPQVTERDIIEIANVGAYGYSMSSNYNCRLRPAEVLITMNGEEKLIRKRESFEDLCRNFI